jgi:predicted hotdog family 3-hydroxylacyl-ACP dehydratase
MSELSSISTSDLKGYLPHRAPMVWIDEVGATTDTGGLAYVTLKPDGLYFSEGVLRPTSIIEFLAQGFGFIAAAHKVRLGNNTAPAVQRAFLVAVTQCQLHDTAAATPNSRLIITVSDVKQLGPIQLFKGQVTTDLGTVLGTASLKVFSE